MLNADDGKLFALDILASAVVKRSLSLCAGFSSLVRSANYTSAAALLRLQLDSCLRFYAAFIVEKPHDFASKIMQGMPVRKQKDRTGHLMTDHYLVEKLSEKHEWMPRIYEATSGFIHLSERHIYSTWKPTSNKESVLMVAGSTDDYFDDAQWQDMTFAFLKTTDTLFEYLKGWIFTKEHPEIVRTIAERMGL